MINNVETNSGFELSPDGSIALQQTETRAWFDKWADNVEAFKREVGGAWRFGTSVASIPPNAFMAVIGSLKRLFSSSVDTYQNHSQSNSEPND